MSITCQYGARPKASAPPWFSYEIADIATVLAITELPGSALMSWLSLALLGIPAGVQQTADL